MRYVYWEIVGLEDTYTDYDFDYMIEKASGQKFYIGRARLFEKAKPPKRLITKSNKKYQFVDLSDGKWHCKVENKKVGFLNWETRSVFQYAHNYSVQPAGGVVGVNAGGCTVSGSTSTGNTCSTPRYNSKGKTLSGYGGDPHNRVIGKQE